MKKLFYVLAMFAPINASAGNNWCCAPGVECNYNINADALFSHSGEWEKPDSDVHDGCETIIPHYRLLSKELEEASSELEKLVDVAVGRDLRREDRQKYDKWREKGYDDQYKGTADSINDLVDKLGADVRHCEVTGKGEICDLRDDVLKKIADLKDLMSNSKTKLKPSKELKSTIALVERQNCSLHQIFRSCDRPSIKSVCD